MLYSQSFRVSVYSEILYFRDSDSIGLCVRYGLPVTLKLPEIRRNAHRVLGSPL